MWIGTLLGIAIAVAVGLFFFQGTLRIPLHRFFAATSAILMVVAFQLALTGLHELSEAEWIWSSKKEMATIGPIVRNEVFFFVVILGAAALVVLREWFGAKRPAPDAAANPAERRKLEWEFRRQRRWSFAAAFLCIAVVLSLTAEFVYARAMNAPSPARALVAQNNEVRIPLGDLQDSSVHFYTADVNNSVIRFLVIHQSNGNLRHRARRLPDLRHRRLPPGRTERGLPQLRRNHLCAFGRRKRRLQSHPREVPRGNWRSDRRSIGAFERHVDDSSIKMFTRLVGESFVRNPRRKILTAAALVVGMAVATATLTVALEVGDRMAREFRSLGANLLVTPQSDSLPLEIGGVDYRPVDEGAYLQEADLGKIKTIFWRHNVLGFTPFLDVPVSVRDAAGSSPVAARGFSDTHRHLV